MKRAIVLAGGGSRGAYELGAWQALDELGESFDGFFGTSIGSLNAALMAQGMTPMDAARVGAYYHGLAGEAAARLRGSRAVTAWDVCEALRIE